MVVYECSGLPYDDCSNSQGARFFATQRDAFASARSESRVADVDDTEIDEVTVERLVVGVKLRDVVNMLNDEGYCYERQRIATFRNGRRVRMG